MMLFGKRNNQYKEFTYILDNMDTKAQGGGSNKNKIDFKNILKQLQINIHAINQKNGIKIFKQIKLLNSNYSNTQFKNIFWWNVPELNKTLDKEATNYIYKINLFNNLLSKKDYYKNNSWNVPKLINHLKGEKLFSKHKHIRRKSFITNDFYNLHKLELTQYNKYVITCQPNQNEIIGYTDTLKDARKYMNEFVDNIYDYCLCNYSNYTIYKKVVSNKCIDIVGIYKFSFVIPYEKTLFSVTISKINKI